MTDTVTVLEGGRPLEFGYEDALRYHGPGFPGGVAHGYCAVRHALALLGADGAAGGGLVERREVSVRTAFPGPGGRDAVELLLRAVTDGRYEVDPALAEPERGPVLARYVWEFTHRGRTVRLHLRDDGLVTEEFIALGARTDRSPAEDARLEVLKTEMAERLLARPVEGVYEEIATEGAR
jgi:hypothetical protein